MPRETSPSAGASAGESGGLDSADSFLREAAAVSEPDETVVATPLRPDDVLSERFVIERLAGRGGMGLVYRALDRMTGLPVALKVMGRSRLRDDRFAQEARVLSELHHPAVVRYVAHGTTSEHEPFLAMEWLDCEDLEARRARRGLGVTESLAVAHRIADALAAAHARGVVHRDVKPSNVLLVGNDARAAKLLDFGLARVKLAGLAPAARALTAREWFSERSGGRCS